MWAWYGHPPQRNIYHELIYLQYLQFVHKNVIVKNRYHFI